MEEIGLDWFFFFFFNCSANFFCSVIILVKRSKKLFSIIIEMFNKLPWKYFWCCKKKKKKEKRVFRYVFPLIGWFNLDSFFFFMWERAAIFASPERLCILKNKINVDAGIISDRPQELKVLRYKMWTFYSITFLCRKCSNMIILNTHWNVRPFSYDCLNKFLVLG